jgi:hypothetical protein
VKWNATIPPAQIDRDLRIDLFRGLALWWIFIDHIPESYLNKFTLKNFGFSDAAEILVFLSGLASGIVYGHVARKSGLTLASLRVLRRGVEIYIAYVVTVVLLLAEVSYLATWQPGMLDHANVAILRDNPAETLLQAIMLRYSPVNLDPLLLMVTLHFGLLVILPVTVRAPLLALIGSVTLYVSAHAFDWYLTAYPRGQIYFNPLNWQLLFVVGVWWGAYRGGWQLAILRSKALAAMAAIYLLFSLLITLGWQIHSLEAYVPAWVARMIYPVDKSNLDILRLLHFFALALLCWRFLPSNLAVLKARALRPLVLCGEYSLVIYCASVLLSFAAHAFLTIGWNTLASQTLVSLAGLAMMSAIATLLAAIDRTAAVHPRPL